MKKLIAIFVCGAVSLGLGGCGFLLSPNLESNLETKSNSAKESTSKITETTDGITKKETETTNETLAVEEVTVEDLKETCRVITYDEIARDPKALENEYVAFTGEVIQNSGNTDYRINITKNSYSYSNTVYVYYELPEDAPRFLEDDIITVYGKSLGFYTYTSILNQEITLPLVAALYVETGTELISENAFNADNVAAQLEVTKRTYSNSFYKYAVINIKNNSDYTIDLKANIKYLNDNETVGVKDAYEDVIAPGQEVVLSRSNDTDFDDFECEISVSETQYYNNVYDMVSINYNIIEQKVIINAVNNGDKPAKFVQYTAVYKNGDSIAYVDTGYLTDNDNEIKPGATISGESKSYYEFDDVEVYFTGRADKN